MIELDLGTCVPNDGSDRRDAEVCYLRNLSCTSISIWRAFSQTRISDVHFPSHGESWSIRVYGAPSVEEVMYDPRRTQNDDVPTEDGEVHDIA